jgi:polyhydroxyalkanoate synthesis regulator phasin
MEVNKMKNFLSFFLLISLFCLGFEAVSAQETNNLVSQNNVSTETKPNTEANVTKNDSLVKLLIKKGVISNEEANELGNISPEQRKNLASLLVKKGIISNSELDELQISESKPNLTQNNLANADIPKVSPASVEKNEAKPVGNSSNFASSVKPIRVFDFNADENKRLIPDI